MANPEHVEIVKQGAAAIAEFRRLHHRDRLDLIGASLAGCDLSGSDLKRAHFKEATLEEANLTNSVIDDTSFRNANLSNAKLCRSFLTKSAFNGAILDGADISQTELMQCSMYNATLRHVKALKTAFVAVDFDGADLQYGNLAKAHFLNNSFCQTDCSHADLTESFHFRSLFRDAKLLSTQFEGATFSDNLIADTDLSQTLNLDLVKHLGPTSLTLDTLLMSRGRVSDSFLRGSGVSNELVAQLLVLFKDRPAIEYASCFISYSHKDEEFCKLLHSRMRDEKLRVWYAPEDMPGGKELQEEIDHAIRVHDKLLLVLSNESIKSNWVATEIGRARKREKHEGTRILFPIRVVPFEVIRDWELFDADEGIDLAKEIRKYFIPDFSNWKDHDAFEAAFQRLLNDLKNESPTKAE